MGGSCRWDRHLHKAGSMITSTGTELFSVPSLMFHITTKGHDVTTSFSRTAGAHQGEQTQVEEPQNNIWQLFQWSSNCCSYGSWQNFIFLSHGYLRDRKRNSQYTGEPHLQHCLKFQPPMSTKETRNVQRTRIERRFNLLFTLRTGKWKGQFESAMIIQALNKYHWTSKQKGK